MSADPSCSRCSGSGEHLSRCACTGAFGVVAPAPPSPREDAWSAELARLRLQEAQRLRDDLRRERIRAVLALREATGLGLSEAKALLERTPLPPRYVL